MNDQEYVIEYNGNFYHLEVKNTIIDRDLFNPQYTETNLLAAWTVVNCEPCKLVQDNTLLNKLEQAIKDQLDLGKETLAETWYQQNTCILQGTGHRCRQTKI